LDEDGCSLVVFVFVIGVAVSLGKLMAEGNPFLLNL
jgi:hypothetical protein